jgi:hypothetical protein
MLSLSLIFVFPCPCKVHRNKPFSGEKTIAQRKKEKRKKRRRLLQKKRQKQNQLKEQWEKCVVLSSLITQN